MGSFLFSLAIRLGFLPKYGLKIIYEQDQNYISFRNKNITKLFKLGHLSNREWGGCEMGAPCPNPNNTNHILLLHMFC